MTTPNVETQSNNNNIEFQTRINNLGDFGIILHQEYEKSKFNRQNESLNSALSRELNNTEKVLMNNFLASIVPKLTELKQKSENPNLSISDIKYLIKADNLPLIPQKIQNNLKYELQKVLKIEFDKLDPIFLEKKQLNNYISNNNSLIDKVAFLENYLTFFSGLNLNEKRYLKDYIEKGSDDIKFLSLQKVEQLGIITTASNFAPEIIPTQTLKKLNELTFQYMQTGVLKPLALQAFIKNEDGLRGIGKKVVTVSKVDLNSTSKSNFDTLKEDVASAQNIAGIEEFESFANNTMFLEIIDLISQGKLNEINLKEFQKMEGDFHIMLKKIQQKHGYIPYNYQLITTQLNSVGEHLFFEENNIETQHSKKMLQFIDMCEQWMRYDEGFDSEEFVLLNNLKTKIVKGKIKKFSEIDKFNDISDVESVLKKYWNYLKDEVLDDSGINDQSIRNLEEKLGAKDDWDIDIFYISMEELDNKISLITGRNGNTFQNIKLAQATDMISWNTSAKEQAFSFIEGDIVEKLISQGVTTHEALEPNSEQVDAEANKLDKQINSNVFLKEISQLHDAQKQVIINSLENTNTQLTGAELDDAVLHAIKNSVLKQTAYRSLLYKNILSMTQDGNNLDGMQRVFMQKHDSLINDILSGTIDISEMIIKEAIIFTVTSILTAGVGGWATTSARIGGYMYTSKIGMGLNAISNYAEKGRSFGQKAMALGLNTTKFASKRAFEAGLYTIGSAAMYEHQEMSLDSYITNLALFAGGIAGVKIGGVFYKRGTESFAKKMTEVLGGSIGGTTALIITEDFPNGLTLEDSSSMMAQGILMGGLMFPLLRSGGLQKNGKKLGEWFANRDSVKANREFNNNNYQTSLDKKLTRNIQAIGDTSYNIGRNNIEMRTRILQNNRNTEANIAARNNDGTKSSTIKGLKNTRDRSINSIENLLLKSKTSIKNTPDSLRLSLNNFLIRNRTARLESLRKIDHTAKYNDLGNGFSLKNGKEIINRDFETVGVLPDGVQVQSVQYLNFGNKRIPTLEMSDGKILRLNKSQALNGNPDVFKNILGKIQNEAGTIEGIYSSRSNIVGYKITHENGNIVYLNKNGNKPHNPNTHKNWEKNFTKHQLASNSKFTTQEIADAGLTIKNKQEFKRNFDKAFKESFPDDATFKKSILERFERIKKDPNATPEQKKEAGRIMGLLGKGWGGIKSIGNITKKTLFYSALAGGGILGIDYLPDNEIDLVDIEGLGMALGTLLLTSDAGLTLIGKLGGKHSTQVTENIKKAKGNNKTISKVLQIGAAILAYDFGSSDNN